jgi:hypothetical protein
MFIVNKKRRITKYKACVKYACNPVYMPVKGVGVAINLQEKSTSPYHKLGRKDTIPGIRLYFLNS